MIQRFIGASLGRDLDDGVGTRMRKQATSTSFYAHRHYQHHQQKIWRKRKAPKIRLERVLQVNIFHTGLGNNKNKKIKPLSPSASWYGAADAITIYSNQLERVRSPPFFDCTTWQLADGCALNSSVSTLFGWTLKTVTNAFPPVQQPVSWTNQRPTLIGAELAETPNGNCSENALSTAHIG